MAQLEKGIIGHRDVLSRLATAVNLKRIPHSMLFVGPSGVGKRRVAMAVAQNLLCEAPQLGRACGDCGSCLRVGKNQSEGVLFIAPEKADIKLDQAKKVGEFLALRALTKARVIVIDEAHKLNPQAGNSLLKLIEEPPKDTYFFLISPSARLVLKTIASRCQVVPFFGLSLEELAQIHPAPAWVLRASQGSAERTEILLQSDELETRKEAEDLMTRLVQEPQCFIEAEVRKSWKDRAQLKSVSHHLLGFMRDAFYLKLGRSEELLNPDKKDFLSVLSQKTFEQIEGIAVLVQNLERDLDANLDTQLAMESFWIKSKDF